MPSVPTQLNPTAPTYAPMADAPPEDRRPVTVRVARWSATHPWRAIGLWLVLVIACLGLGSGVGLRSMTQLDSGAGQSGLAARILHQAKLDDPAQENVLITGRSGALQRESADAAAAAVTTRMQSLSAVASVAAPVVAQDQSALRVPIVMSGDPETASDRVQTLLGVTAAVQKQYPDLRIDEVGGASLNQGVNEQVSSDLGSAALISLPVTLLILAVTFGAIVAAGVPVLLALSAVAAATGLSTLVSHLIPDSGSTSSMILLMGMAVGVDYSLFYVKRAREEFARGATRLDAIEIAAETSGHSVIVSGVAVIVSMVGLFAARNSVFASLAVGSIVVVAIAVVGSLTVLPAILVKLGGRIDRLRVPVLWRISAASTSRESRFWSTLLGPALRRPDRTLLVSVLLLLALAVPALGLTLETSPDSQLPRTIPAVQAMDRLSAAFPSEQATHDIVVRAPAAASDHVAAALGELNQRLRSNPLFDATALQLRTSSDRTVHELLVPVPFDSESNQAKDGLRELRSGLLADGVGRIAGATWAIGGDTAESVDSVQQLSDGMRWVIPCVVLMTMAMMLIVFRSVMLALVTAFVNLLSAGAAFGVLVLTFQHTWAEGLLGFHSTGAVVNWIPLFCFAVLFGLSMDYHVFVVSRIREEVARGASTQVAVRRGILGSAGTVTSAAVVMISVFAIFAALPMVEMKELGIGLAVAVAIDAVVVRAILLPALLVRLGSHTWAPARLTVE